MEGGHVNGLRMFLLVVLDLILSGEQISNIYIEDNLTGGIAKVLYEKYKTTFDKLGFNPDNIEVVNEYFRQYYGVADAQEHKYIKHDNGLALLLGLALNEIF